MAPDPASIGPYRVLGRLGEGAMGVVYRGQDPRNAEDVAIKTARAGESTAANLRSEMRALSRIEDPRIVHIIGYGDDGGAPWYAMEYLEGRTWQAFNKEMWASLQAVSAAPTNSTMNHEVYSAATLSGDGDLPALDIPGPHVPAPLGRRAQAGAGRLVEVLTLARKLCPPLAVLHGRGLVHRDLKPANVILRPSGDPVIMDLGVVSRFRGAVGRERIEVSGSLVGTLAYMAPEQARGLAVDARADLYSLGCMLYESVTGRVPISDTTLSSMLARVIADAPEPPSVLVEGVPPELENLILRLLEKDPRARIGFADDVAAVLDRLGAVDDRPATLSRPYLYRPELVGREAQVKALEGHIAAAAQGHGGLVFIGGESGVGKTFLASEAARIARTRRVGVVLGECQPAVVTDATVVETTGAPLHPFRSVLTSIADRARSGGETATRRLLGDRTLILAPFEPSLATLPGSGSWTPPTELPPELARARLFRALCDTLDAWLVVAGPVVLILDDLQWADDLSLAFLRSLPADWLGRRPLLILGTWRSGEADAALVSMLDAPGVSRIDLARLDATRVRAIVGDMLAMNAPPPTFIEAVSAWSEGNPFFVAEYLRMAAAEGFLQRRGGRWELAARAGAALPEPRSVQELVGRRLAALGEVARRTAQAAAVLGREFALPLLGALVELDADALADALRELEERQVVEAVTADRYRFVHDKLREASYARIDAAQRHLWHARAARALEADALAGRATGVARTLASHWREAGEPARAMDPLERAGAEALRNFSNPEAIACFQELKEINSQLPQAVGPLRMARWDRALADACLDQGDQAAGQQYVDHALTALGYTGLPRSPAAQVLAVLGQVLVRVAQHGLPTLFAEQRPDRRSVLVDAAHLYNRLLEPKMLNNEPLLGAYCGLRNLNLADRTAPSPAMARGYGMMAAIVANSPLKRLALRWADRSVEVADRLDSPATLTYALHRGAVAYVVVGDWAEATRRFERALTLSEGHGDRRRWEESIVARAICHLARGRFAPCAEDAFAALASATARGDMQTTAWSRALLLEALARLGRDDELAEIEAETLSDRAPLGDAERTWLQSAIAIARLQRGDLVGAGVAAGAALAIVARSPPVGYFMGTPIASLTETCVRLWELAARDGGPDVAGARARALQTRDVLVGLGRMLSFLEPFTLTWQGSVDWQEGRAARARRRWQQAAAAATRLNMWQAEGQALLELGRHAEGEARRAPLEAASTLFGQSGSVRDERRARDAGR